jgi:hypothetical protein
LKRVNVPYPLITDIAQGRCLPFVGAGFSKNAALPPGYSMPDWKELTATLAPHAGMDPNSPAPVVSQRYQQRFGRVQLIEAIREALHPDKVRPGKAHRSFVQLPFDTVYTTNFDLLLEDAYSDVTRPFRSLVGELQLPFHAGQIASSVIKMHGDLRHEEHIIITQRDYDEFMERYPVIATHLSAMLITRTPLFIGYSLSDPDFANIRRIVRARLGAFERMAYVVQFDVDEQHIEKALDDKLHIISVDSSAGSSRDEVLSDFFASIQEQLDTKVGASLRNSRPDLFEEIETEVVRKAVQSPEHSPVIETTSHLCFVMMPFGEKFDEIYRNLIVPVARDNGLTVLRADEIAAPGSITEQIRTAIQQSRLCIADLTGSNPNVLFEIGYTQASAKPLVMLADEASHLPFDIAHQRVILYGTDMEKAQHLLQRAISTVLSSERLAEAERLLNLRQYRGAIAAASVVLEQRLRQLLGKRQPQKRLERMTLGQLASAATNRRQLGALSGRLVEVIELRNRAVHEVDEPTREQAEFVVETVREIIATLPEDE